MSHLAANITHLMHTQETKWDTLRKASSFKGDDYEWSFGIKEPTIDQLIAIANHFGRSIDDLIKRDIAEKHIQESLFETSKQES